MITSICQAPGSTQGCSVRVRACVSGGSGGGGLSGAPIMDLDRQETSLGASAVRTGGR